SSLHPSTPLLRSIRIPALSMMIFPLFAVAAFHHVEAPSSRNIPPRTLATMTCVLPESVPPVNNQTMAQILNPQQSGMRQHPYTLIRSSNSTVTGFGFACCCCHNSFHRASTDGCESGVSPSPPDILGNIA